MLKGQVVVAAAVPPQVVQVAILGLQVLALAPQLVLVAQLVIHPSQQDQVFSHRLKFLKIITGLEVVMVILSVKVFQLISLIIMDINKE